MSAALPPVLVAAPGEPGAAAAQAEAAVEIAQIEAGTAEARIASDTQVALAGIEAAAEGEAARLDAQEGQAEWQTAVDSLRQDFKTEMDGLREAVNTLGTSLTPQQAAEVQQVAAETVVEVLTPSTEEAPPVESPAAPAEMVEVPQAPPPAPPARPAKVRRFL